MLNKKVIFGFLIFVVVSFTIFSLAQTPEEEGPVDYPSEDVDNIDWDDTIPVETSDDEQPENEGNEQEDTGNNETLVNNETNNGTPTNPETPTNNENVIIKYTITFNTNGGSSISPITIVKGSKATKPANPTKEGYNFVEWRVKTESGAVWSFNTAINGNLTLVAIWEEIKKEPDPTPEPEPETPTQPDPDPTPPVTPPVTPVDNSIKKQLTNSVVTSGSGIYDVSGTMDYIYKGSSSNNYVYYSGLVWRIVGITSSGNLKLISDVPLATISIHDGSEVGFTSSYAYSWLNNYFKPKLYNNSSLLKGNVELMSESDFNNSIVDGSTYISTNADLWTMTANGSSYKYASSTSINSRTSSSLLNVKPVIYISASIDYTSGTGTSSNPYMIKNGNKSTPSSTINQRVVGEYVKFDSRIWRIVETGDNVKLVLNSKVNITALSDIRNYNAESSVLTTDGMELVQSVNWSYILGAQAINYGSLSFNGRPTIGSLRVGMLRAGEIFSGYDLSTSYMLLNTDENHKPYRTTMTGMDSISTTNLRPAVYVQGTMKITSGSGTKASPFVISK